MMNEGLIYFYQGRKGSGKTLTMVRDAHIFHLNGWNVYANFEVSFATKITNEEFLNFDKNKSLQNCVILIDEIQSLLDNRQSMSKKNVKSSHFIQQIRKKGIQLLATAQFSNTVDLRFKQHVDYEIYPRYIKQDKGDITRVTIIDRTAIIDSFGDESELQDIVTQIDFFYDPISVFGMYDTREMVA